MSNPHQSPLRLLLILSGAASAMFAQGRPDLALAQLGNAAHVPTEVIVQYRAGATALQRSAAVSRISGNRDSNVVNGAWRRDGRGDADVVRLPAGLSVAAAVLGLRGDPAVEFVEPNWVYQHSAVSNDTYYTNGSLWGMYGSGTVPANTYGIGAATPWAANRTGSAAVHVAVIDEGVFISHADLKPNIWVNSKEIAGDRRDNDGNGYIDDVNGWDFDGNNNSVYDGTQDDHGTHVAGTIGAVGGNAAGVAGVCWNVKIIPVKFLGTAGGTTANAVKAVNYVTDLKRRHGLNIVAINASWGGGGYSQALYDAIAAANAEGILFVAAAGNNASNNDLVASYPSNYALDNVIAVAAITQTGALATFSNYGATTVHLGAPGSAIWSTIPGRSNTSSYASYSGTSMATPHVTGACALWASANSATLSAATTPAAAAALIKAAVLNGAVATPSLAGKTRSGARLNVSGF